MSNRIRWTLSLALLLPTLAFAADVTLQIDVGDSFVVTNNDGTVQRFRVDEATGNIYRNDVLYVHNTGSIWSLFVGEDVGTAATGATNTGIGQEALRDVTSGFGNTGIGRGALKRVTSGWGNVAVGGSAAHWITTGTQVTAVGSVAVGNQTGHGNSAFGANALLGPPVCCGSGNFNSAFGLNALRVSEGSDNSAFGQAALTSATTGDGNDAFGFAALGSVTTAGHNAAFGSFALSSHTTGGNNTAVGHNALINHTTGDGNIAIGASAGANHTTGSDNIFIGNSGPVGVASNTIFIGESASSTYIDGIFTSPMLGSTVMIDSSNRLGTIVSSARFKEDVRDMASSSDVLMDLRPVTFRYREEAGGDGSTRDYGLIAEEVAAVAPGLVVYDKAREPYSVRYQALAPLLVNEVQKQRRTIEEQRKLIAALAGRLERLESVLETEVEGSNR